MGTVDLNSDPRTAGHRSSAWIRRAGFVRGVARR